MQKASILTARANMDVGVCEMQDEEAGEAAASAAIPPGLLKHPSLPLIQPGTGCTALLLMI